MRMGRLTSSVAWSAALVAGALAATALSPTGAKASLLDGSFANNITAGLGFSTFNSGSTLVSGDWTVTSGSVDQIGSYWQAPPGTPFPTGGSVDLDGNSPGAITQTFSQTTGGLYDLTFQLSGNPDGGPGVKSLAVTVNGVTQDLTYTVTGANTHGNMLYASESLFFSLVSGSNTISFASTDTSGDYGAVVGNVSLTATPLPATWTMLLAGFAGLGFIAYRGAKKSSAIAAA